MPKAPPTTEPHIERPGPAEFRDPIVRRELQKAAVWFGMALAIVGVVFLGQPLLLIIGGGSVSALVACGVPPFRRGVPIPPRGPVLPVPLLVFRFFLRV